VERIIFDFETITQGGSNVYIVHRRVRLNL